MPESPGSELPGRIGNYILHTLWILTEMPLGKEISVRIYCTKINAVKILTVYCMPHITEMIKMIVMVLGETT